MRELQNVIERAAILSSGVELGLDGTFLDKPVATTRKAASDGDGLGGDDLNEMTKSHLLRVLNSSDWVIEGPHGAAVRLGIKPSTLRFRMQKLSIKKP